MRLIYCTLLVCCLAASTAFATAEIALVDGSGVEYYINTNITFSTTSSSASGAVSDATYTTIASGVTTTGGETVSTFLSDAFDGYNGMLVGAR